MVLVAFAALQACVKDEEKVFDASAAERTSEAVNNLRDLLVAEPNGWVVEYYPETDRSLGGYNFLWKFNEDGTVLIAGERATANYQAGDTVRSYYDVIANRGVVLTFDTYNEVFHYFSEPSYSDMDGFSGDYEFVWRESTPAKIVMTGKKRGNRLEMTPYTGGDASTWKAYLEQFSVLDRKMAAVDYFVHVNDTSAWGFEKVTRKYRAFSFTYKKEEDNKIVPYITTPTGIKTYEPLTVDGITAQYFTLDEVAHKLIGADGGNIDIEILPPPDANVIVSTLDDYWFIDDARCSSSFQTLITTATNQLLTSGYSLYYEYLFCGRSPLDNNMMFSFYARQNTSYYWLIYNFAYTPVPGTADQINITYTGPANLNASLVPAIASGIMATITSKSPYVILLDDPVEPNEFRLTSAADPNFYITAYY